MDKTAPILCAGITMYDPIKCYGGCEGKKMKIGIIGIGGLGTMGIKIAKALGHEVVAISTSIKKENIAKEKGAHHFIDSTNSESLNKHTMSCDLILNTVSANHDINTYMPILAKKGIIVQLGATPVPH